MADKVNSKPEKKKNAMTPEQRSRRTQQILFGMLAIIMIVSMVISLVAR
jgi:hypothetical protein